MWQALNFNLNRFFTYQETNVENQPTGLSVPEVNPVYNIVNTVSEEHLSTPNFYGGLYLNWIPIDKLNINVNPYYMSSYTMYHPNDLVGDTTIGEMGGNILVNAKVSYQFLNDLRIYANARNLFSGDQAQFYGTDVVKPMILGGISFRF